MDILQDAYEIDALILQDKVALFTSDVEPSTAGVVAPLGSFYVNNLDGKWYKKYGSLDSEWLEVTVGTFPTLNDILDVQVTNPLDGQVLKFDATGNFWYNGTDETGGGSSDGGNFDDVMVYGDTGLVSNKFLGNASNNQLSSNSSPIALHDGEITGLTISTESDSTANFYMIVVINAIKNGGGSLSGGTQIGVDLEKPSGSLDYFYSALTGINFAQGDRISVYIKKGNVGLKKAREPVVRLFLKYNTSNSLPNGAGSV